MTNQAALQEQQDYYSARAQEYGETGHLLPVKG